MATWFLDRCSNHPGNNTNVVVWKQNKTKQDTRLRRTFYNEHTRQTYAADIRFETAKQCLKKAVHGCFVSLIVKE